MKPTRWIPALLLGTLAVAGSALALTPEEIIKARKTPPSGVAIALPMHPEPPGTCDPAHGGWMYLDVKSRDNASLPCVCLQDKDATWKWVAFGTPRAECD